ncbi:uncharacterized protein AB675_8353 [Cyphellophora attinorum]|uniref:Uncharacterized protein n=1 Tax=Cyphellophora attinorum TaxID=1664694 RepID=A0A0N1P218_9EURO|nr:uncharacterized protein AB675_8353 [Phialophora attinorum]KPI44736.1 hypothetical protein AB675_8353 [Phialophora attinorum]
MDKPGAELISSVAFGIIAALLALVGIYQGARHWACCSHRQPGQDSNGTDSETAIAMPNDTTSRMELSPASPALNGNTFCTTTDTAHPHTVTDDHVAVDNDLALHSAAANEVTAENASRPLSLVIAVARCADGSHADSSDANT